MVGRLEVGRLNPVKERRDTGLKIWKRQIASTRFVPCRQVRKDTNPRNDDYAAIFRGVNILTILNYAVGYFHLTSMLK